MKQIFLLALLILVFPVHAQDDLTPINLFDLEPITQDNLSQLQLLQTFELKSYAGQFDIAPDSRSALIATGYPTVFQWQLASGQITYVANPDDHSFNTFLHHPDGKAALANNGGPMTVWDLDTLGPAFALPLHAGGPVYGFYTQDGDRIITTDGFVTLGTGHIFIWDADSGDLLAELISAEEEILYVNQLRLLPDGRHLISQDDIGIHLWDITTYEKIKTLNYTVSGYATRIALTPDPNIIFIADSQSAFLWDMTSDAAIDQVSVPETFISPSARSSDHALYAFSGSTGSTHVWSLDGTIEERSVWPIRSRRLAFNSDGSLLAMGENNGNILIVDPYDSRMATKIYQSNVEYPTQIAFSPDDKLLFVSWRVHPSEAESRLEVWGIPPDS